MNPNEAKQKDMKNDVICIKPVELDWGNWYV